MMRILRFSNKTLDVHIRVQNYLLISFLQRLWLYFIKKNWYILIHFIFGQLIKNQSLCIFLHP